MTLAVTSLEYPDPEEEMGYRLGDGDILVDGGRYHMLTLAEDGLTFDIHGHLSGGYSSMEVSYLDALRRFDIGAQVLEHYGPSGWHLWKRER